MNRILLLFITVFYTTVMFAQNQEDISVYIFQSQRTDSKLVRNIMITNDGYLNTKTKYVNYKENSKPECDVELEESYVLDSEKYEHYYHNITELLTGSKFLKSITRKQFKMYQKMIDDEKLPKELNFMIIRNKKEYFLLRYDKVDKDYSDMIINAEQEDRDRHKSSYIRILRVLKRITKDGRRSNNF